MKVPFYLAEDVVAELGAAGVPFESAEVVSVLSFADTSENRGKILRFLFGKRLGEFDRGTLEGFFDRWRTAEGLVMENRDRIFQRMAR